MSNDYFDHYYKISKCIELFEIIFYIQSLNLDRNCY